MDNDPGPATPQRVRHPHRPVMAGTTDLCAIHVEPGDVIHDRDEWCRVVAVVRSGDADVDIPELDYYRLLELRTDVAESRGKVALVYVMPGHTDLFTWTMGSFDPVRVQVWAQPDGTTDPLETTG